MHAWIFPTPASVALRPTGASIEFEVLSDVPLWFAVEVASDATLFDAVNQVRRTSVLPGLNFFNTFYGAPGIPGLHYRTPPSPRMTIAIPNAVTAALATVERIYYRVIAFQGLNQGAPAGQMFYSTRDQGARQAPYIHVRLSTVTPYYVRGTQSTSRQRTPRLMVHGNKLIEGARSTASPTQAAAASPRVLRGVNFSGLQYRQHHWGTPDVPSLASHTWREAAGITQDRIREIAGWGARIIRLPINQGWVLNGVAGKNGLDYLADIDQIVDWAADEGMYTLLELHLLDDRLLRTQSQTQPMPDNLSLPFWAILANRYRTDPAVIYDLCNEPHKPRQDEWTLYKTAYGGYVPASDAGWIELWHEWARQIERVIHHASPDAVIFVSGIGGPCFAASLRSMPVPVPPFSVRMLRHLPNAVYSCHIYYKEQDDRDGVDDSSGNRGTKDAKDWFYWFGFERLRRMCPIFLGEFGAEPRDFNSNYPNVPQPQSVEHDMRQWGIALIGYLNGLRGTQGTMAEGGVRPRGDREWQGLAGWTSWSWGNAPHLVERLPAPAGQEPPYRVIRVGNVSRHVPTSFGELVRTELLGP